MDSINREILKILEKDSRTPFLQIAKKLGVSEGTIRKRVEKLVESRVITKFTIEISAQNQIEAIVGIRLKPQTKLQGTAGVIESLRKKGVEDVYEVSGRYDLICIARAQDTYDLNELLDNIRRVGHVVETESFIVLRKN